MTKRQIIALLALGGVFLSTYLTLHNLGYIGTLTCTIGSCETVQTSRWSRMFGIPVALWGVGYYLSILVLAILGETVRFGAARWISAALVALTGWGVIYSGWLTYLELAVIHAVCIYCVTSAALAVALFGLAFRDFREGQLS